jgi:hypothetical protein
VSFARHAPEEIVRETIASHETVLRGEAREVTLEARLRLVRGKHFDAEAHPARILALGPTSAEVACPVPVAPLDPVQLLFCWHDGGPLSRTRS